jgi:phosphoribosylformylglycinamidine synthase
LFEGMVGSLLPIAVSHGEGRAAFDDPHALAKLSAEGGIAMRYVDHQGVAAVRYPANPNGSPLGIAAITTSDGRVTLTMPHPERVYRAAQNSWRPANWHEDGGWMRLFRNARIAVG